MHRVTDGQIISPIYLLLIGKNKLFFLFTKNIECMQHSAKCFYIHHLSSYKCVRQVAVNLCRSVVSAHGQADDGNSLKDTITHHINSLPGHRNGLPLFDDLAGSQSSM